MATVRIATRSSRLALWQAKHVAHLLQMRHPGVSVELVPLVSTGDVDRTKPLYEIGGVGLFTKEIQEAVLDCRADVAVHSLKDLPTTSHPDLTLAGVPERGSVEDVLIAREGHTLASLPKGSRVATSSLRRIAQLRLRRPDLSTLPVRGNIETRLKKVHDGEFDAIILARAGLARLQMEDDISEILEEDVMMPAVGQGALGIECRSDDSEARFLLTSIDHADTRARVEAERALLRTLQAGCQAPLGAATSMDGDELELRAVLLSPDGQRSMRESLKGPRAEAPRIGERLAKTLISQGAGELLG